MIIFTKDNIINTEGFKNFRFYKYNDEEWHITCLTSVYEIIWEGRDKSVGEKIFDKIKVAVFNKAEIFVVKE